MRRIRVFKPAFEFIGGTWRPYRQIGKRTRCARMRLFADEDYLMVECPVPWVLPQYAWLSAWPGRNRGFDGFCLNIWRGFRWLTCNRWLPRPIRWFCGRCEDSYFRFAVQGY